MAIAWLSARSAIMRVVPSAVRASAPGVINLSTSRDAPSSVGLIATLLVHRDEIFRPILKMNVDWALTQEDKVFHDGPPATEEGEEEESAAASENSGKREGEEQLVNKEDQGRYKGWLWARPGELEPEPAEEQGGSRYDDDWLWSKEEPEPESEPQPSSSSSSDKGGRYEEDGWLWADDEKGEKGEGEKGGRYDDGWLWAKGDKDSEKGEGGGRYDDGWLWSTSQPLVIA